MRSAAALAIASALLSASPAPAPPQRCHPAPVVVQTPTIAANSTYNSDAEPPRRFARLPKGYVRVEFGQSKINAECGRPPCDMVFLGCNRDDLIVLPDPFTTDAETFARVTRHELGHFNGWPDTHGD